MKFKMAEKSLFAILLRSPWWVSFVLVMVFALASLALLPAQYAPFGVMGGFPFLVIGVIAAWRQWHAPSPARLAQALEQARGMAWGEFSSALERAFVSQGHAVTRLGGKAADFQLVKAGRTTLVSCKRWKAANHGVEGLRELIAAKVAQDATHCSYVSLGEVTDKARRLAREQGVELLSGSRLGALLLSARRRKA